MLFISKFEAQDWARKYRACKGPECGYRMDPGDIFILDRTAWSVTTGVQRQEPLGHAERKRPPPREGPGEIDS